MTELTETEALNKVAAYCASAEHCRTEVIEKMQRWGMPYNTIDRIVERLVAEKYIDEERYCRAFVNDKYRFAKWGKVKIGQALYLKKIPRFTYQPYLNEIDEEEQADPFCPEPRLRNEGYTPLHRCFGRK